MYARHRWLTPAGLAVVALVVFANAGSSVGLGFSAPALVVTIGVVAYAVAALVFLLWFDAPAWANVLLLVIMAAAAIATHHGDPTGTGGIGLYLGMVFAPLRLPLRPALIVSVASALAFDVQLALEADNPLVFSAVVDGGAAFFFLLGLLLRTEHEQRTRADSMVEELERTREAEREAAALAERARLAREVHDVLAHTLSGLVVQLDGAVLHARATGEDREIVALVERAHALARDGLAEARQAVGALRGETLPGPEALPALVTGHATAAGGRHSFDVIGDPQPLPADARVALYRTAQEALSNVAKHAPGSDVAVRLCWAGDRVDLEVVDTGGRGHPLLGPSGSGYGLIGLQERAEMLGGQLHAAARGSGFAVNLSLPVPLGGNR